MKALMMALVLCASVQSFALVQNCNEEELINFAISELKAEHYPTLGPFPSAHHFGGRVVGQSDSHPITEVEIYTYVPHAFPAITSSFKIVTESYISNLFITKPEITFVSDANGTITKKICSATWSNSQGISDSNQLIINQDGKYIAPHKIPVFPLVQEMSLN